jgi:uncharacterized protein (TIGR02246 family)
MSGRKVIMRSKPMTVWVVALSLVVALSTCQAENDSASEAAIRKIVSDFETAWTKCDAKALAGLWIEDGDFLSPYGTFAKGRAEIEKFYASALASGYCGSSGTGTISNIRLLGDEVAIIDGEWGIKGKHNQNGQAMPEEKGLFTAVAKKTGTRWLIVAQREMVPASP